MYWEQSRAMNSQLANSDVTEFLNGDKSHHGRASNSLKTINSGDYIYKRFEGILDERLLQSPHSFHFDELQIVNAPSQLSDTFRSHLGLINSNPHLVFHGTKQSNHESIFNTGFSLSKEYWGDSDKGYIGKGIYLSPHPEYAASYIKGTPGITRYAYYEPVSVGITCKLLGCLALTRRTKQMHQKCYGQEIPSDLESHWAWVTKDGDVTAAPNQFFALEYALKLPVDVYPRFTVSLTRVTREVVWVDPNILNSENSGYTHELKQEKGISLYATSNSSKALEALKKKKNGTDYRAITAGRGGEDFVSKLRTAEIHCKVMVFCGAVDYHKQWARKFSNVEVTSSPSTMKQFATWRY